MSDREPNTRERQGRQPARFAVVVPPPAERVCRAPARARASTRTRRLREAAPTRRAI